MAHSTLKSIVALSSFLLAFLSTAIIAPDARAVESDKGWYIGMGGGLYRESSDVLQDAGTASALKGFVGYQFVKFIAFEAGFIDFDNLESTPLPGFTDKIEVDGPYARAFLSIPIWSNADRAVMLSASGGAFRWDAHEKIFFDATGTKVASAREHDVKGIVGFGVWIKGNKASTRIEYQRYRDIGAIDLDLLSINFIYHFGKGR